METTILFLKTTWCIYLLGGWAAAFEATAIHNELDGLTEAEEALEVVLYTVSHINYYAPH